MEIFTSTETMVLVNYQFSKFHFKINLVEELCLNQFYLKVHSSSKIS